MDPDLNQWPFALWDDAQPLRHTSQAKAILSRLGDIAYLPNAQKQHKKIGKVNRLKNTLQIKEWDNIPEKEQTNWRRHLPGKGFKAMVIKMFY